MHMDERFSERMTLLELLQLLRKRLALVIALPIVCALAMVLLHGQYVYGLYEPVCAHENGSL